MGPVTRRELRLHGELPARRGALSILMAALGGLLTTWAFPAYGYWILALPGLLLLVMAVDRTTAGKAFLAGTVFGLAFFLPHLSWAPVATETTLPWLALSLIEAVCIGVWALAAAWIRVWAPARTPLGQALTWGVLWAAVEELRSRVPFGGFPWGKLAYVNVDSPLGNLAPLGGEVLVGAATIVLVVLIRRTFSLHPAQTSPSWWGRPSLLLASIALILVPAWGMSLPNAAEAGTLKVGVVQGNIDPLAHSTFREHLRVTRAHADEAKRLAASGAALDLVVWGENSLSEDPRQDPEAAAIVSEAVDATGVPNLVGFVHYLEDGTRLNYMGVWYPHTGLDESSLYAKQHPVPFGEYIPMRDLVTRLATEAAQVNVDMVPGDKPAIQNVRLNDGREIGVATGICFEVAYEPLLAEGVRLGGQMVAIPTNNYTFKNSGESEQQIQMLRFRSMEFGRSGLQASTTGVSALVRPDGSVMARTELLVPAHITAELPLRTSITPAARMGQVPAFVAMALGAALLLIGIIGNIAVSADERRAARAPRGPRNGAAKGRAPKGNPTKARPRQTAGRR